MTVLDLHWSIVCPHAAEISWLVLVSYVASHCWIFIDVLYILVLLKSLEQ
jgi:hypothetical protein